MFSKSAAIGLALVLLGACSPITVNLMPAPEAFRFRQAEAFQRTPDAEKDPVVSVLYATTRIPAREKDGDPYGKNFDDTLRMGVSGILIGDNPEISWNELRQLSVGEERDRELPLRLTQVNECASLLPGQDLEALPAQLQAFMERINQALDSSLDPDLLIFVHGARNTFYRSMGQAAQYRHFAGRNSVVLAFAWPSMGSLWFYGTDVKRARESARRLADLMELLARYSKARRLNILGYSLGAEVVSNALLQLRQDHAEIPGRELQDALRIQDVYYAAPDMEVSKFAKQLKRYSDMVGRVSVTINVNDKVLKMSQLHNRTSRAGRPDADELDEEETNFLVEASARSNFDVIDAASAVSVFDALEAHDYWYNNPRVSTDVLMQMLFHLAPDQRGLDSIVTDRGFTVWYFPDDYQQRVPAIIDALDEEVSGAGEKK
jgi:esterase/lipase superfamily enzyme